MKRKSSMIPNETHVHENESGKQFKQQREKCVTLSTHKWGKHTVWFAAARRNAKPRAA